MRPRLLELGSVTGNIPLPSVGLVADLVASWYSSSADDCPCGYSLNWREAAAPADGVRCLVGREKINVLSVPADPQHSQAVHSSLFPSRQG